MTDGTRINEKKLANKRFKKTEDLMLRSFLKEKDISVSKLSNKTGVARSSVYYHHKSVREIVPDYEKYILEQHKKMIKEMMKMPNARVKIIYFRTLCFVRSNQQVFEILMEDNGDKVFYEMVKVMEKKLVVIMRLPKNSRTLFKVYVSEVARLIYEWGRQGFRESEIDKVLERMMFLTETARVRLKILLD